MLSLVYGNKRGKLSANCSQHPPINVLIIFAMDNITVYHFVAMKGGTERKVNSGCPLWSGEDNKVGIANEH